MSVETAVRPARERERDVTGLVRRVVRHRLAGPAAVTLILGVLYVLFAAYQWRRLINPSWDLGIFTQAVGQYAQFNAPIDVLRGGPGFNLLGDHFSPILAILAPVYWVFPHAFMLMVAQAVLLAVSAFPVTRAAGRVVGPRSAVVVGLAYGLSWGLQSGAAVQFHEYAFAVPLLAFSLEALTRRQWITSAAWALPLVFVKEDLGLTVAMLGVVIAWRSRRWILSALVAVWGAGWFVVTVYVLIPAASKSGKWTYASTLSFGKLAAHPLHTLAELFTPEIKFGTFWLVLLVVGLACLRSSMCWLIVPTLAWRFLSTNYGYWGHGWHYSMVLMPIVFLALIDAIPKLRASRHHWMRSYGRAAVLIVAVVCVATMAGKPLMRLTQPSSWQHSDAWHNAQEALTYIPEGVSVQTDLTMLNLLVDRDTVYWIGEDKTPAPDYFVIHVKKDTKWPAVRRAENQHKGADYVNVYAHDGLQIAMRAG